MIEEKPFPPPDVYAIVAVTLVDELGMRCVIEQCMEYHPAKLLAEAWTKQRGCLAYIHSIEGQSRPIKAVYINGGAHLV